MPNRVRHVSTDRHWTGRSAGRSLRPRGCAPAACPLLEAAPRDPHPPARHEYPSWKTPHALDCCTYQPARCSGLDYDFDPTTPGSNEDGLLPTGSLASRGATAGASRVFDLSGNVREFTAARTAGVNPLRGGSYYHTQHGMACRFSWSV